MSYESSPACRLLATHCCACGRPLTDAVSVEAGIGPDCRKNHGYKVAQHDADWDEYQALTGGVASDGTPRTLANAITYRIAADPAAPTVRRDILALSALGFTTLAETLADRVKSATTIRLDTRKPFLILTTGYNSRLVEELRYVRGRRWDAATKTNVFPLTSEGELFAALRKVYQPDLTFVVRDGRIGTLGDAAPPVRQGVLRLVAS